MAPRVDGTQLHGNSGIGSAVAAAGHGQSTSFLGAVDQPIQHRVLYRRQVSDVEGKSFRGCAQRTAASAHRVQSTLTGRTPRAVADPAWRSNPRRAAGT